MAIEQEDMFPELLPKEEAGSPPLEKKKDLTELEKLEEEMDRCPQCDTGFCGRHTEMHRILVTGRNKD